jgi:hypothetical protein
MPKKLIVYMTCKNCRRTKQATIAKPDVPLSHLNADFACTPWGKITGCGWSGWVKLTKSRPATKQPTKHRPGVKHVASPKFKRPL